MKSYLLPIVAAITAASSPVFAGSVSVFDYNAVVTNNYDTTSHVNGDVYVKNMTYRNSPVFDGNVKVAGTLSGSNYINGASGKTFTTISQTVSNSYNLNNATKAVDSTLSINSLSSNLTSYSNAYAAYATTSKATSTVNGNVLTFAYSGSAIDQAVFTISLATLTSIGDRIDLSLGNAKSAVINVTGTGSGSLNANITFSSLASSVLWNFVDASSFTLNRTIAGTVMGDGLTLTMNNSNVDGGVYVQNLNQYGEIHNYIYTGSKPTQLEVGGAGAPAIPLPSAAFFGSPLLAMLMLRRHSRR